MLEPALASRRRRLFTRGLDVLSSFQQDISGFLVQVSDAAGGTAGAEVQQSDRRVDLSPKSGSVLSRAISTFESMHEDLDAFLRDLLKLGKNRPREPAHAWLALPLDAYMLEVQELQGINVDVAREAAATSAAAKRLRTQAEEASRAAAALRQQAWAKETASSQAAVQAVEAEADSERYQLSGDLAGGLKHIRLANRCAPARHHRIAPGNLALPPKPPAFPPFSHTHTPHTYTLVHLCPAPPGCGRPPR